MISRSKNKLVRNSCTWSELRGPPIFNMRMPVLAFEDAKTDDVDRHAYRK